MSILARRYAQALMNLAAKDKQVQPVAEALDEVAGMLAGSPPLRAYLGEPKVALADKEAVVTRLLERSQVPGLVSTFVRFVTRKRRIALLEDIRRAYHELADERMGRANADVTVVAELTAQEQEALQRRLADLSGKVVRVRVRLGPDILGGLVARIGSTVWDGSLRNQLNRIQDAIMKG